MELILIGLLLFAGIPAFVASSKGRGFFLWYVYGLFLFPFAFIHAIVIKPNELATGMAKCPSCASVISKDAKVCPSCRTRLDGSDVESTNTLVSKQESEANFNGERNVSSSSYQLFLTKRFAVEKNATLEKYVIGNDVFDTLEDSLREADDRYTKQLTTAWAKEQSARREAELLAEKAEVERAMKEKREAQERADYLKREEELAPIRAAKKRKVNIIFIVIAIICVPVFSVFVYNSISDRRQIVQLKTEENERNAIAAKNADSLLIKQKEAIERTNKLLLNMFVEREFFGLRIGANNLSLLDNLMDISKMNWVGESSGYGSDGKYYYVTYRDSIEKLTNNSELASRLNAISFSYCANGVSALNLKNKSSYKNFVLNGVYFDFKDHADADKTHTMIYEGERSLVTLGNNKLLLVGPRYSSSETTVALYRTGISSSFLNETGRDPCGNKTK